MSDKSIGDWSAWPNYTTENFLVWIPEELQQYTDTDPRELADWDYRKKKQFDLILDCVAALLPHDIECEYDYNTEYYLHPETDDVWKDLCDCGWEYCDECHANPKDYGYKPVRDFDLSTLSLRYIIDDKSRQLSKMVLNNEVSWTDVQFDWFPDRESKENFGTIDAVKDYFAGNPMGDYDVERSCIFHWNVCTFLYKTDYWLQERFLFPRYYNTFK